MYKLKVTRHCSKEKFAVIITGQILFSISLDPHQLFFQANHLLPMNSSVNSSVSQQRAEANERTEARRRTLFSVSAGNAGTLPPDPTNRRPQMYTNLSRQLHFAESVVDGPQISEEQAQALSTEYFSRGSRTGEWILPSWYDPGDNPFVCLWKEEPGHICTGIDVETETARDIFFLVPGKPLLCYNSPICRLLARARICIGAGISGDALTQAMEEYDSALYLTLTQNVNQTGHLYKKQN